AFFCNRLLLLFCLFPNLRLCLFLPCRARSASTPGLPSAPRPSLDDQRTRASPVGVEDRPEILSDLGALEDDARIAVLIDAGRRKVLAADDNGPAVDHEALVVHVGLSTDVGGQIDALGLHLLTP